MKLDYEKTFKIEVLNEFSNGVYADLVNFIIKNGIDKEDKTNFYVVLLNQFEQFLNFNLFEMTFDELEALEGYWENMSNYVEGFKGK